MFADSRLANYCKQPRLKARFTAITGFAFKDLQINRLQNFLGFSSVAAAATQGPAETGRMKSLQFSLNLGNVHRVYLHGFTVFILLVAPARVSYDSDAETVRSASGALARP